MVIDTFSLVLLTMVGAVVLAVGLGTQRLRWHRVWSFAGVLCGLFAFAAIGPMMPTIAIARLTGPLLVGAGIGLMYPTLFRDPPDLLGAPPKDSDALLLWRANARETLDKAKVGPLSWALTAALLAPSVWLIQLGREWGLASLVVAGVIGALGPAWAAVGLLRRSESLRRLAARSVDDNDAV